MFLELFYVIGNCFLLHKKRSAMDATGAQMYMQAKACAHQRAKSCKQLFVLKNMSTAPIVGYNEGIMLDIEGIRELVCSWC